MITGRVADASLFLAPLVHELGWALGRLGPPGRRRRRRPPARVQRPGDGRQLLRAVVGEPRPDCASAFPIAEVEADGTAVITKPAAPAAWSRSTPCASSCSTRCTTRPRYLSPDVVADFTSLTARRPGRRPRARERHARRAGARHLQGAGVHACRLGRRGPPGVLVARRRGQGPRRAAASCATRAEAAGVPVEEWHEEYFGVERATAARPSAGRPPSASRPRSSAGWRGAPPTPSRRAGWHGRSACSASPARRRSAGIGPRRRRQAHPAAGGRALPASTATLVDAQVRVDVEEVETGGQDPAARPVRRPARATRATSATSRCSPTTRRPTRRSGRRSPPSGSRRTSASWSRARSCATRPPTCWRSSSSCTTRSAAGRPRSLRSDNLGKTHGASLLRHVDRRARRRRGQRAPPARAPAGLIAPLPRIVLVALNHRQGG